MFDLSRKLLRLERKGEPLAPHRMFVGRVAISIVLAALVVLVALFAGMALFLHLDPKASCHKAFHRAAMILSGMGAAEQDSDDETILIGVYALFSSFVVVTVIALILTPVLHRILHHFHLEENGGDEEAASLPRHSRPELRKSAKRKP